MTGTRFGYGERVYVFPPWMQSISDNFADLVSNVQRMPSLDGYFDAFGLDKAPIEAGQVQMEFSIPAEWAQQEYGISDAEDALQAARDAVRAIAHWGKTKLFKVVGTTERWCWARVVSMNMPLNNPKMQRVSLAFQVSLPYWFEQGTEEPQWGEFQWGSVEWGGSVSPQTCTGTATTWTVTTNGNAPTLPRISIIGLAGGMTNLVLQRIVDAQVVDEVSYTDSLLEDDTLEINCRAKRVQLNGADAYDNHFEYETPDWFKLEPGENTLRLLMSSSGNQAQVYMRYFEAYT